MPTSHSSRFAAQRIEATFAVTTRERHDAVRYVTAPGHLSRARAGDRCQLTATVGHLTPSDVSER